MPHTITTNDGSFLFQTAPGAPIGSESYTTRMVIDNGGNVGIGTTNPLTGLDVSNGLTLRAGNTSQNANNGVDTALSTTQSIVVNGTSSGTNINLNGQFVGHLLITVNWGGDTGTPMATAVISADASLDNGGGELLSDVQLVSFNNESGTYYSWATSPAVAIYDPNNGSTPAIVVEGLLNTNIYLADITVTATITGNVYRSNALSLSLPGGSALSTNWLATPTLQLVTGDVGLGTMHPDARLTLDGPDSSQSGPHLDVYTTADNYPLYQQLNWAHNNVALNFDAYYNGNWHSS